MQPPLRPPTEIISILNQLFEIEQKAKKLKEENSIQRNVLRIKDFFEQSGFFYEDPIGQPFGDTRTDCEAHIAGQSTEDLVIIEVLKPVIRIKTEGVSKIIQKGVVIVKSKKDIKE